MSRRTPRSTPTKRQSYAESDQELTPPSSPSKKLKKTPSSLASKKTPSRTPSTPAVAPTLTGPVTDAPLTVPSHLSFDIEQAKQHLINADVCLLS